MQITKLKFSEKEVKEFNDFYLKGHTIKQVAEQFNVSYRDVLHYLIRFGFYKPTKNYGDKRKFKVDDYYFDNIDSDDKAYFLGLLLSDGYICKELYAKRFGIALKCEDKYILDYFNDKIAPDKKISKYKNSYKLSINSNRIYDKLVEYGFKEKKSTRDYHFPNIPETYIHSFIRGYFDGDGCVTIKKTGFSVVSIVCNSKIFLEEFANKLLEYGIKTRPLNVSYRTQQPLYTLYISRRENQLKFKNFIYKNASIYLKRKYNKFMLIPC